MVRLGLVAGVLAAWALAPSARAQEETRPSFGEWLAAIRTEAIERGIREEIVERALADIQEPLAIVVERDRSQAEVVLSLEAYVQRRITRRMVTMAREMFRQHRDLLDRVGSAYGVSPATIVAIWGLESNFGRFTGVRPTVAALATLAWEGRRSALFRRELFHALEILNRGDVDLPALRGSWAGAMGQPQFMPSSYLRFAEDFDGDGRRDIWRSPPDVFASIASYLKGHGWKAGERWGREVTVSTEAATAIASTVERRDGSCQATRTMTTARTLREWNALGVRSAGGKPLPDSEASAALVSGDTRHFLVSANYDALLAYNCAHAYAVSVGLLADKVGG